MEVAVAALGGFGVLVAAAFGFRTILYRRQTGESAWVVAPTRAAWVGDTLFGLGVAGTLLAPILELLGPVDTLDVLEAPAVQVLGAAALGTGSTVALVAQAQMGTAWRAGIELMADYPLVTSGLFGVVRNPFYLGFMTASLGVAAMVPSVPAFVASLLLIAGCETDVRLVEEPHLRSTHGSDYACYAASTPRFLPGRRFGERRRSG